MKRTIKVYKPCELCEGTGLTEVNGYIENCPHCLGHGENIEKVYKDVNINELELPAGR